MKTLQEKIETLNNLVLAGKPLDAFETFYHPDVKMQENEETPTIGKEANLAREIDFFGKVTGFSENARILDVAYGDNVTMVKWQYDYIHKEWGKKNYTQVAVQHWKDGQIINEQFFYGN
jgi:hypothetical protein